MEDDNENKKKRTRCKYRMRLNDTIFSVFNSPVAINHLLLDVATNCTRYRAPFYFRNYLFGICIILCVVPLKFMSIFSCSAVKYAACCCTLGMYITAETERLYEAFILKLASVFSEKRCQLFHF